VSNPLGGIARTVGYFGTIENAGSLAIDGWILAPAGRMLDGCELHLDGQRVAVAPLHVMQEAQLPAYFPEGSAMGFAFTGIRPSLPLRDFTRIDVTGCVGGQAVSRISTFLRTGVTFADPPEHLMRRVTGNGDPRIVREAGARCAREFLDSLTAHRPLRHVRRILDWGCGYGRVTQHLLDAMAKHPGTQVDGCDLDREAIAWADANLRSGAFTVGTPEPPLPWPDGTFDAVLACSVFTHLTRELQEAWLREMQRVIAPGGMLLASVFSHEAEFSDSVHDPVLDGIAPDGYYRFTVQSRAQVTAEWSRWFDLAEFVPYGLESAQHLVVMRRRAVAGPAEPAPPVEIHAPPVLLDRPALSRAAPAGAFPPGHFYSPIPDWDEIGRNAERIFASDAELPGIDLRTDAQLALLEELAEFDDELPWGRLEGVRYTTANSNFGPGDAAVLHAMLRRFAPRRVVEVGSGYSSCAIVDTNELFFDGEIECTFIDPEPALLRSLLREGDPATILGQRVQDVPLETFTGLEAGDVLFVDSSHVLKTGSDLNHLLFEVLPRLQRGVLVHFHDVFYPFEYPREWVTDLGLAWNEVYALRAFLQFNARFEIVFFSHYLAKTRPGLFLDRLPAIRENAGGSLWLRRV
jgi:SAM-dependent methyltransferase